MNDRSRLRLVVLRALVFSLFATLLGRLAYVQLVDGANFAKVALSNEQRLVVTPAPRGLILDDAGRVLAGNADAEVVSLDRSELLRQPGGGSQVLARLAGLLHLSFATLLDRSQPCDAHGQPAGCWNGSPYQPIPVATVPVATAFALQEQPAAYPGVSVAVTSVRDYPQYTADPATRVYASHLLGYLGPISQSELAALPPAQQALAANELVGRSGLEEQYNAALSGRAGVEEISVDHLGNPIGVLSQVPPVPGDDLVTSIDAGVQRDLEQALVFAVHSARAFGVAGGAGPANTAAGVVMDADTGRIIAMASYPTYAPNAFVGGISTGAYAQLLSPANGSPLSNYAIQGSYLPGSTFKLITSSAVLAAGEAVPGGRYDCPPGVTFFGHYFHNFESESAGMISLANAIAMSCDSVFYGFGEEQYTADEQLIAEHKPPAEIVAHMAMDYGLGSPTGVDLPGESSGFIYDRAGIYQYWKDYLQPNACAGAKNPHFSATRRASDAYYCAYGGIYLPGYQLEMDIGQGSSIGVTPLQMAVAYSALVNGGTVWSPRIGAALISPAGRVVESIKPVVRAHVPVPAADLTYIRDAMYRVTQQTSPVAGTGTYAFGSYPFGPFPFNKVDVGGKTGTASVTNAAAPTAWFDSFAGPAGRAPDLVSAIVVTNGGQGGIASAPATRLVWDDVFGLEGHHADFPGGYPPTALPAIDAQGVAVSPAPLPPAAPETPGAVALGPPADLRWRGAG